ncbi:hypothetical protein [Massilia sp. TN1-12]|uniref:hypothetical protein n=1 Tax=Massilia paldalensis TaxID=3377675 RepID=UPI0038512E8A
MKLRLTQPGYESFTGQMGTVFFEDGLSTADVKPIDAVRMAAQFLCEWEDGSAASVAQSILDHAFATTNSIPSAINADQALATQRAEAAQLAGHTHQPDGTAAPAHRYTEDELSAIADERGIKGLRAIAEPLGVKGNSISDMIRAILGKQGA